MLDEIAHSLITFAISTIFLFLCWQLYDAVCQWPECCYDLASGLDILTPPPVTTLNYSTTADLHTLQFTTAHAKPFSSLLALLTVCWQRLLTVETFQLPAFRSFLRRRSFRTACQIFQLNWIANHHLQNSTNSQLSVGLGSSLHSLGVDPT
jgi:hypothetical protein